MKESKISLGIALGLCFGAGIGSVTDNVGLWAGIGLLAGVIIGTTLEKKTKWKKHLTYF